MAKEILVRNSSAEFLSFVAKAKEDGVQVLFKDEAIWATQKAMATLFEVGIPAIHKHLSNIYSDGELRREATVSKMEIVQCEGSREVSPGQGRSSARGCCDICQRYKKKAIHNGSENAVAHLLAIAIICSSVVFSGTLLLHKQIYPPKFFAKVYQLIF